MTRSNSRTKVQAKEHHQARQSNEVSAARSTSELSLPIPDQFNEAISFSSKEPVMAQIVGLGDERLSIVQRQALATQVGLRQGNRYLNRVVTESVNKDSESFRVQRQPTQEQPNRQLGNLVVSGESVQNTTPQQAIDLLRNRVLFQLQMQYERDFDRHKAQKKLRDEHYIVGAVSDFAGRVRMPPLDMWNEPRRRLDVAEAAIRSGDIHEAIHRLKSAEAWLNSVHRRLYHYIEGTIEGAERAVTGLEVTRDLSFATVGVAATIATGGVGGALIGTGVTAAGQVAQQGAEISHGLRDQIDWGGITFDALFGLVASYLGGKIGGYVAGKIIGSNPAAASLGRQAVARIVDNLVSGRAEAVIQGAARSLFDTLRGQAKAMTPAQFAHMLIEELTDPRSIFMDIVGGEIAHAVHTRAARRTSPSESTPSTTGPALVEPTGSNPEPVGLTSTSPEPVPALESRASEPLAAVVAPEPAPATPVSTEPVPTASAPGEPAPPAPNPAAEPIPTEPAPTTATPESVRATSGPEPVQPVGPRSEPVEAPGAQPEPVEPTGAQSESAEPIGPETEPVEPGAEPTTEPTSATETEATGQQGPERSSARDSLDNHLENMLENDIDPQRDLGYNAEEWEQFQRNYELDPERALADLESRLDRHGIRAEMTEGSPTEPESAGRIPEVPSSPLDLPEYQESIEAARRAMTNLPEAPGVKTVAGIEGGTPTRSGYNPTEQFPSAAEATESAMVEGAEAGQAPEPHPFDSSATAGDSGRVHGSHAEKQAAVLSPDDPVGVSKPMCLDCQAWFRQRAIDRGVPQFVADPEGTRVFMPDGTVHMEPHPEGMLGPRGTPR